MENPQPTNVQPTDDFYLTRIFQQRAYCLEDLQEGGAEWLERKMGGGKARPKALRHPVAGVLQDTNAAVSDLLAFIVAPQNASRAAANPRAMAGDLDTQVFSDMFSTAAREIARTRVNDQIAAVRAVCQIIIARDYRTVSAAVVDVGMFSDEPDAEGSSVGTAKAAATGEEIAVRRWSRNLSFSREMALSDDFSAIGATLRGATAAASRRVGRSFAQLLTSNGNLKDGAAWFGSDNTVATAELSTAAISTATAKLVNLPLTDGAYEVTGDIVGTPPAHLLVPSTHWAEALIIVSAMTAAGDPPLRVTALPWLDGSNYFYLLPDPADAPAIAMSLLRESGPLSIDPLPPFVTSSDSWPWRLRLEFGLAPVSRSIVRGTLS